MSSVYHNSDVLIRLLETDLEVGIIFGREHLNAGPSVSTDSFGWQGDESWSVTPWREGWKITGTTHKIGYKTLADAVGTARNYDVYVLELTVQREPEYYVMNQVCRTTHGCNGLTIMFPDSTTRSDHVHVRYNFRV